MSASSKMADGHNTPIYEIIEIFAGANDVAISSNTTFDTNMANGLIATDSLQGQVATRFFQSNTELIDQQLEVDWRWRTARPKQTLWVKLRSTR